MRTSSKPLDLVLSLYTGNSIYIEYDFAKVCQNNKDGKLRGKRGRFLEKDYLDVLAEQATDDAGDDDGDDDDY